jgi:hypothetical protein
MPNGAATTGRGQNLIADVICWKLRMARFTSSQSPSCMASSSCIRFAPTEKFSASLEITNPRKSRTESLPGFSTEPSSETTSPPIADFGECSSRHPIPSPKSTSDAPEFFFTTPNLPPTATRKSAIAAWPATLRNRLHPGRERRKTRRAAFGIPAREAGGQQRLHSRANRQIQLPKPLDRQDTPAASHIANGPSSQLNPA